MIKFIAALVFLMSSTANSSQFTEEVKDKQFVLHLIHNIWSTEKVQPEIGKAIFLRETRGITNLSSVVGDVSQPRGKRSYGIMQVKVITARDVLRNNPMACIKYFKTSRCDKLSTASIVNKLMENMPFNITMAALHYKRLSNMLPSKMAIAAYNGGVAGVTAKYNHSAFLYANAVTNYVFYLKKVGVDKQARKIV